MPKIIQILCFNLYISCAFPLGDYDGSYKMHTRTHEHNSSKRPNESFHVDGTRCDAAIH